MIATKHRVPREKIDYLLRKGASSTSKLFIIRYNKTEEDISRYRTIVSRKISTKAVERNKLRRQIYEAIRTSVKDRQNRDKFDIILIPKKRITETSFDEIQRDIKDIITNIQPPHGKVQ